MTSTMKKRKKATKTKSRKRTKKTTTWRRMRKKTTKNSLGLGPKSRPVRVTSIKVSSASNLGKRHISSRSPQTMRLPILHSTVFACSLIASAMLLSAQEPPASRPTPPPQTAPSAESSSKPSQARNSHGDDFLVRGTVFTQEGLALPGAELRIRRSSEKKFRWDTASNSRGEFAVRVKMGSDYEVVVRAKGFQEQALPVNAATGERVKELVFRLQRQTGKKS